MCRYLLLYAQRVKQRKEVITIIEVSMMKGVINKIFNNFVFGNLT